MQRSSFQTEVLSNSGGPLEHVGERHSSAAQGQSPDHHFHSKSIKDFPPRLCYQKLLVLPSWKSQSSCYETGTTINWGIACVFFM